VPPSSAASDELSSSPVSPAAPSSSGPAATLSLPLFPDESLESEWPHPASIKTASAIINTSPHTANFRSDFTSLIFFLDPILAISLPPRLGNKNLRIDRPNLSNFSFVNTTTRYAIETPPYLEKNPKGHAQEEENNTYNRSKP
jgi:hypothetical protein